MEKKIPGTSKVQSSKDAFLEFKRLIELTDGISLGQVCSIAGLEPMIIQNWVKRGYVSRPVKKKYHEKQFARILLINSLKGALQIETIGKLMKLVNGDVEDESDDLISEADLYNMFSNVVYELDDDKEIEKFIKKEMKSVNMNDDKLFTALAVMVHAYFASKEKGIALNYLNTLETY